MAVAGFIFSLFLAFVTFWAWPGLESYQAEMASQQTLDRDPAKQPETPTKENP